MFVNATPEILEGFHLCEPEHPEIVDTKIGNLAARGHIAIFDVDLTLTTNGHTDEDVDVSSWGAFREQLSPHAQEADEALYQLFRPRERDDTLSEEDSEFWWNATLGLYVRDGINISAVDRAVNTIRMRDGAVGLSQTCDELGIPEAWLSAGIWNVLRGLADKHQMTPDIILATRLRHDTEGQVTGWVKNSVIHPHNKKARGHSEITRLRKPFPGSVESEDVEYVYPGTLLVGDSIKDPRMVDGDGNVLRIRVAEPHPSMTIEEYIAQSREAGYDLVIKEQGLWPVSSLMRYIATQRTQGQPELPRIETQE